MMLGRQEPNFIINNRPVSQFPLIVQKITCPICCIMFQKKHTPMISCPSGHTICANCLQGIIKKALLTPQNPAACPMCRKRIQLPLQMNQQYKQFVKLLESIGELLFAMALQGQQLKQKSSRIATMDFEIKRKNQEIMEMMKKMRSAQMERDKVKQENVRLKRVVEELTLSLKRRQNVETDVEGEQKVQRKEMIKLENPSKIPNKQVQIDRKFPLTQLFRDQQLIENRLTLMRKQFSYQQIQLISFHDLSQLIELNLACNKIDNTGFKILIQQTNLVNLTNLNVANNHISQLPNNIQPLTRLQYFNIGNFMGEERRTCNRLRQSSFDKMLQHKWEQLKTIDVQFDTDLIWDNQQNLDKLVVQWPAVSMINICTFTMKMTKKKCQQLGKTLNMKAKRPGLTRIYVGIKSNH